MNFSQQLGAHLHQFYFGQSLIGINLKKLLENVDYQMANRSIYSQNTIAFWVCHISYNLELTLNVFRGGIITDEDEKFYVEILAVNSEQGWQSLLTKIFSQARELVFEVERLEQENLIKDFADLRYGNIFRNIVRLLEQGYYYRGYIVSTKRIIEQKEKYANARAFTFVAFPPVVSINQ